jgi:hypothetical protein
MLREREAKIYMQRSQAIYFDSTPHMLQQQQQHGATNTKLNKQTIRTELFCFSIENLELYALSDLDWHGRHKCYRILRQIDHASPEPSANNRQQSNGNEESLPTNEPFNPAEHYSIMWCRHISVNIGGDLKLTFRDYTQPLVKIQKLNMWGKLLGAEYEPAFRSRRSVKMGL